MKKKVLLLALFLFAISVRFWGLGSIPSGLNRDEAALAYNASLLADTGYDEWHQAWPVTLRSFGDYKLIGYPALITGLFRVLPRTDWVVRLPSALAGVLIVGLMMLIARDVLAFSSESVRRVGWLSATLPVFLFYARMAFEATVGLSALLCLLWLLFSPKGPKAFLFWRVVASAGVAAAAFVTYNTPWLLFPFFLPLCLWWWWRSWQWGVFLVGVVACMWMVVATHVIPLTQQKSGITIFQDETLRMESAAYYQHWPQSLRPVLGNTYVFFGQQAAKRFAATLSPTFIVLHGGTHPWHSLPGWGHMSWLVYLLGWLGCGWFFISQRRFLSSQKQRSLWLLFFWTLLAPLPAIVTVDAPHATRSLFFFACWVWWAALGFETLSVRHRMIEPLLWVVLAVSTTWYCWTYFVFYKQESRVLFLSGLAETAQEATQSTPASTPIAVIDEDGYAYIQLAWYLHVPPSVFFETVVRHLPDKIGFSYGYRLGQFRFIKAVGDRLPTETTWLIWDGAQAKWLQQRLK